MKLFFYVLKGGVFLFASEIKALLAHPLVEPEIDIHSIEEIMLIGPGRTPGCGVFREIEGLLPATCGFFDHNGLKLRQYRKLDDKGHTDTFAQTVERVRALVIDSIERQLVSDVPTKSLAIIHGIGIKRFVKETASHGHSPSLIVRAF